jgi:hypothetical protein
MTDAMLNAPPVPAMPSDAMPSRRILGFTRMRALISGFILFHLIAIIAVSIPSVSLVLLRTKGATTQYLLWTGLWQSWNMFAPQPPTFNFTMSAEVIRRSGQITWWTLPVPSDSGYARQYVIERYRKWGADNLRRPSDAALWPDAARFIAHVYNSPSDPPDTVRLFREWQSIPPIDSGPHARPSRWYAKLFFTYAVQPRDLQ